MTEQQRMQAGMLHHPEYGEAVSCEVQVAIRKFNMSDYWAESSSLEKLKGFFGQCDSSVKLSPPFYCDNGQLISFGKRFTGAMGLYIQDRAPVTFGEHVSIGPNVSIYTVVTPVDAMVRNLGFESSAPVCIADNVRIEGGSIICPGVTVGADSVILHGSVVRENIPSGVIAGGNPCVVIREITETERENWRRQLSEYMEDEDIRNQSLARDNMLSFGSELTPEEKQTYDRIAASAEQLSIFDVINN